MGSLLFTILSFIVALAILITVHEYGHFWVARKLGVKVLRFSIGFGRALWKRTSEVDGTEYVIAAIPLGGYVKMLDEREAPVDPEEQQRAFNRQPLGVRSAIVVAGPLFNFLFAILAFWLIFVTGDTGLKPLVGKVESGSIAEQAGFIPGDEILSVANQSTPTWESVVYILLSEALDSTSLSIQVRDKAGDEQHYQLQSLGLSDLSEDGRLLQNLGLTPDRPILPPVIGDVLVGEPAEEAGLRPGDRIISVDGSAVDNWNDWVSYVRERPSVALNLEVDRDGETIPMVITPATIESEGETIGRIGASVTVPDNLMDDYRAVIKYGPVEAIGQSVTKTWDLSLLMLRMLGKMVIGEVSVKNLSGPISIADSAGKSASYGVSYFLKFLAVVSVSLGVLNLLPIPVLDGGHLFFFLIEAIQGKPLSERFMEQGQKIGLLILLGVMGLAFYIDLNRFLG
ncbi:MAG: sigma E protease regulator RseP [Candidatus Thiodiazotropha sp.]|nr:sigma E protease regulator RseP [Candidatus Thiodiazotropha sp.]MCU7801797.1 sigma E protease regulator RseP [Candidatus Thiodiazotropha sp. (ex Lucinoma borealis)]MCU7838002.1 sigma E protease regulator RseP [Candidatus Thiodiazotropha sp. (ex Troendleina suluensis)]MCM8883826.1 sigma E protease regulator RseP [Candidatus Thiodiazotropha sp.]MCM8919457.1 sigma E protease regulator RseP [Candidatus Thiodiazotropha sp.]